MRQRLDAHRARLFLGFTMRNLLLVMVLGAPSLLAGQVEPLLAPGSRVRVRNLTESGTLDRGFEGDLDRISGDTLVLHPRWGGTRQTFLANPSSQLFVFTGKHSAVLKGAAIGGTIGLLTGSFIAAAAGEVCESDDVLCTQRRPIAVKAGVLFGLTGAATGLLIGVFASYEDWARSMKYWGVRPAVSIGARWISGGLTVSF